MGVKCVPVFEKFIIPETKTIETTGVFENDFGGIESILEEVNINAGEFVKEIAEEYCGGADPVGKTHVREGVVARIINRPTFKAYKHKNFEFKVLENIVKVNADAPDMEEAEEGVE
jgi:hypothetical protein